MNKTNIDFFQDGLYKNLSKMCSNLKKNDELEASFGSLKNPISLKTFHDFLQYAKVKSSENNLSFNTSIDLLYRYEYNSNSTYRITINTYDRVNNFIENYKMYNNHILYSKQIQLYNMKDNKTIILINKMRSDNNLILLDEYNIRIRLSEENDNISEETINKLSYLNESEKVNITFRYKQRCSLVIEENEYYKFSLDITDVKTNNNLNYIYDTLSKYEIELDFSIKRKVSVKILEEILKKLNEKVLEIEKFIQQSNILITKTEEINVIKCLKKLAYDNENEQYKDLPGMQVESLELHHLIDVLPGLYSITDKTDGERYFIIIFNSNIYLVSNNLKVKKIKENISDKYNLTVLDGEYLYIGDPYYKYIFIIFDILFDAGVDVRLEENLYKRLLIVEKILLNLFNYKMYIGNYTKDYNISNIIKFNEENMVNHLTQLEKLLIETKENNVIVGKYFIFPMKISSENDIYKLSQLLYETYTNGVIKKCPYMLDGIIYTPLNQIYTRSKKNTKYSILKWKSEENNTIDFYIEFERDSLTNKIITVFDKTILNDDDEDEINNNIFYQIVNLYCGSVRNNIENPVLFQPDKNNHIAYLVINVNEDFPRDSMGEIIKDKTCVEFSYNNSSLLNKYFKWIPKKTRYDKTESVVRYKRKYGNNIFTANLIWNNINNPISFSDIKLLADDKTINKHSEKLKNRMDAEYINIIRRDDEYYQLTTNIAADMRTYNNWIKSNLISLYCNKVDVLDIGFGRGGDIQKYYTARVKSLVGIDVNASGITSGSDGAISRYTNLKKKFPQYPPMKFLVVDCRMKFDYASQIILGKLGEDMKNGIMETFGKNTEDKNYKKFDIFNIQFTIHFLLENNNSFENLLYNINKYLNVGGYVLITTTDNKMLHETFENGEIIKKHIGNDGNSILLYRYIQKYNKDIDFNDLSYENNIGNQIELFNSIYSEVDQTEYLVNSKFLIKEFREKCNLKLIETELMHNIYQTYQHFFEFGAPYESKKETREFFKNVGKFYNHNNQNNKDWYDFYKLNRYYIFQKLK